MADEAIIRLIQNSYLSIISVKGGSVVLVVSGVDFELIVSPLRDAMASFIFR